MCGKEICMNTILEFAGITRNLASWNIGMRRIKKILIEEKRNGFRAIQTGMYSDDLDILVFRGEELVRVYEVTNYDVKGYIQRHTGARYKRNLLRWDVEKVFVCSSDKNLVPLGGRKFFTQHGIKVVVKGYQD